MNSWIQCIEIAGILPLFRFLDGYHHLVDSIFRNHDALASLSRLKSFDDYTFQHSLNVSVLALTLGRHLGIVQGELRRLGIGSILQLRRIGAARLGLACRGDVKEMHRFRLSQRAVADKARHGRRIIPSS